MSTNKIILRCDDFDPRIDLATLVPLHEEFVKRKIPMTIAVNNCMGHRIGFTQAVLDYVNSTDYWDIQLHGWEHERYWTMKLPHVVRDMYCNLEWTKKDFKNSDPKIFYPPWNETSTFLEEACRIYGLELKRFDCTIRELMWAGRADRDGFYWHWWTPDDRAIIPQALDRLIELNKQRGFTYE